MQLPDVDLDVVLKTHYRSCLDEGTLEYLRPLLHGVSSFIRQDTKWRCPTPLLLVRKVPLINLPLVQEHLQVLHPNTRVEEVGPGCEQRVRLDGNSPVCFLAEATTEGQCARVADLMAAIHSQEDAALRAAEAAGVDNTTTKPWCVVVFSDVAVSSAGLTRTLNLRYQTNFRILELAKHTMHTDGLADTLACALLDPYSPLLPSAATFDSLTRLAKSRSPAKLMHAVNNWLELVDYDMVERAFSGYSEARIVNASCSSQDATLQDFVATRARVLFGLSSGLQIVIRKGTVGEVTKVRRMVVKMWEHICASQGRLEAHMAADFAAAVSLELSDVHLLKGFAPPADAAEGLVLQMAREHHLRQITALGTCHAAVFAAWHPRLVLPDITHDLNCRLHVDQPGREPHPQREVLWALCSATTAWPVPTVVQRVQKQDKALKRKEAMSKESIEQAITQLVSNSVLRYGEGGVVPMLPLAVVEGDEGAASQPSLRGPEGEAAPVVPPPPARLRQKPVPEKARGRMAKACLRGVDANHGGDWAVNLVGRRAKKNTGISSQDLPVMPEHDPEALEFPPEPECEPEPEPTPPRKPARRAARAAPASPPPAPEPVPVVSKKAAKQPAAAVVSAKTAPKAAPAAAQERDMTSSSCVVREMEPPSSTEAPEGRVVYEESAEVHNGAPSDAPLLPKKLPGRSVLPVSTESGEPSTRPACADPSSPIISSLARAHTRSAPSTETSLKKRPLENPSPAPPTTAAKRQRRQGAGRSGAKASTADVSSESGGPTVTTDERTMFSECPHVMKVMQKPVGSSPNPDLPSAEYDKDLFYCTFNLLRDSLPMLPDHAKPSAWFSAHELRPNSVVSARKKMKSGLYRWIEWDNDKGNWYLASTLLDMLRNRLLQHEAYTKAQVESAYAKVLDLKGRGVIVHPERAMQLKERGWVEEHDLPAEGTDWRSVLQSLKVAEPFYLRICSKVIDEEDGVDINKVYPGKFESGDVYQRKYPKCLLGFLHEQFGTQTSDRQLMRLLKPQMEVRIPYVRWLDDPVASLAIELLRTAMHRDMLTADIGHMTIDGVVMQGCMRNFRHEPVLSQESGAPTKIKGLKQGLVWYYKERETRPSEDEDTCTVVRDDGADVMQSQSTQQSYNLHEDDDEAGDF